LPEMIAYIATQCTGGIGGTIAAHLMFDLPWCSTSAHARNGSALLFSELWRASAFCALSGDARGCVPV
jgi:glycerol uptake facilitator-like aquaporin